MDKVKSLLNITVEEQRSIFLNAIFHDNPYLVGLRAISSSERRKAFIAHTDEDFFDYFIRQYNNNFNIYFIVNSVWGGQKKEHVKLVNAFFADFDAKDYGGNFKPIVEGINSFELVPSFINHSGNGLHCYWILERPLEVGREITRVEFEGIQKGLALHLKSDQAVTDINNVMRLPGAYNVKDLANKKMCQVIAMTDNRYLVEQFKSFHIAVEDSVSSDFSGFVTDSRYVTDNEMVDNCMEMLFDLEYLAGWEKTGVEMKFFCPFHGDGRNPNGRLNVIKGVFNCLSCKEGGSVRTLRDHLKLKLLQRLIKEK